MTVDKTDSKLKIFISYAHEDEKWSRELETHLAALRRKGIVEIWNDRKIGAGKEWAEQIDENLKSADVVLLLVSPDFIASDYCWRIEAGHAMARHEAGEAVVIPIIVRSADWSGAPFSKLQVLPRNAEPISLWPDKDAAFLDVVKGVRNEITRLIERRNRARSESPPTSLEDRERAWRAPTEPPETSRRSFARWGVGAVLLLLAAALVLFTRRDTNPPRVAVLGFANRTDFIESMDWLETAITEMLAAELEAGSGIRVFHPETVAEARVALSIEDPERMDSDQLRELQSLFGVDFCIHGIYRGQQPSPLRFEMRVRNTHTGEILTEHVAEGSTDALFMLIDEASRKLRSELGASELTDTERAEVRSLFPENPKVLRLFSEGLRRFMGFDDKEALKKLEEAVDDDPEHPRLYQVLGSLYLNLGRMTQAEEAYDRASALASGLPARFRIDIQARRHLARGETRDAARVYREFWEKDRGDSRAGVRLAEALIMSQEADSALVVLAEIRRQTLPIATAKELDLLEARARLQLDDLARARESIERALAGSDRLGAVFLAQAHFFSAQVYESSRDYPRALAELRDAYVKFDLCGDRHSLLEVFERMASIFSQQGDLDGARRQFEEYLGKYRERGDSYGEALVRANLGVVYAEMGLFDKAESALEISWQTFHDLKAWLEGATTVTNLATILQELGRLSEAREKYAVALTVCEELGDRSLIATVRTNLGEILFLSGELDRAREMHSTALEINREIGDEAGIAYDDYRLGLVSLAQGHRREARSFFSKALEIQSTLGPPNSYATTLLGLVELDLFESDFMQAKEHAREALRIFLEEGLPDPAALAHVALAGVLLDQPVPELAEAREISDLVRYYAETSQDPRVRFVSALLAARVEAVSVEDEEQRAKIRRTLEALAQQALDGGSLPDHFEARLALAKIDFKAGNVEAARANIAELIRDAHEKGFQMTVERAQWISGE